MDENKKTTFPKIPESNWWAIRRQFKKTIPGIVNVTYLKTLLDLGTDKAARNLIAPLKALGLINDDGKPTARANEWRDDDNYSKVCNDIVVEIYPQELLDLYPENEDLDKKSISKWFMSKCAIGEGAANLIASTFILLKEATIKEDLPLKMSKKVKEKNHLKSEITKEDTKDRCVTKENFFDSNKNMMPLIKNGPSMHIDLQIHISPDATAEQIDCIFASISKHLYK